MNSLTPHIPESDIDAGGPRPRAHFAAAALAVFAVFAAATISSGQDYVVSPGDTLSSIAVNNGTSVSAIANANSISNPNRIIAGQVLTIPGGTGASGSSGGSYRVAAGDTLSDIAVRNGTTVAALVSANGLGNANFIRQGTTLTIPGGGSSAGGTSAGGTHRVGSGENLAIIANRYGTTVSWLVSQNGLSNPNLIREGITLQVPGSGSASGSGSGSSSTPIGTQAAPLLDHWGSVYGVPIDLLKALTWFESGWNNTKISSAGAIGVGQLMPDTVDFLSDGLIGERIDPHNLSDNIRGSARFLRYLLDETGWDARTALGGYYQGLASVRRDGIFTSSIFYVDGILALRNRF